MALDRIYFQLRRSRSNHNKKTCERDGERERRYKGAVEGGSSCQYYSRLRPLHTANQSVSEPAVAMKLIPRWQRQRPWWRLHWHWSTCLFRSVASLSSSSPSSKHRDRSWRYWQPCAPATGWLHWRCHAKRPLSHFCTSSLVCNLRNGSIAMHRTDSELR